MDTTRGQNGTDLNDLCAYYSEMFILRKGVALKQTVVNY